MTLDLYGFVYTDRANFLFDGVGVGSAEQGHEGRGQHDLKNLYFLLDKTVFMQNMSKACKVAYMDFLRVHMSTPTPGCSWGGSVPQPFSAHLTRQVTIPTLRMRFSMTEKYEFPFIFDTDHVKFSSCL